MVPSPEYEAKQRRFWKKLSETPEHEIYTQFQTEHYYSKKEPDQTPCERLERITEIPLIGVRMTQNPFEIRENLYVKPFFLFERNTPPMKKIPVDKGIEKGLEFLGGIHTICWGLEGYYGPRELFINLAEFFKKNQEEIPNYFDLEISGLREYENEEMRRKWISSEQSYTFCLSLFRDTK